MPSTIKTVARLNQCRSQLTSSLNEWGETQVWPGLVDPSGLPGSARPFFYHTVIAGLVPPFSPFFMAVLEHYQICALHLQLNSVTTFAIFACWCEMFVGVKPSAVLLWHMYALRLTSTSRVAGCASFVKEGSFGLPMGWSKRVEDFWKRWLLIDAQDDNPHLLPPTIAKKASGRWSTASLEGDKVDALISRIEELNTSGLTGPLVSMEYLRLRIAPLQKHNKDLWDFVASDHLTLGDGITDDPEVADFIHELLHTSTAAELPEGVRPLYLDPRKAEILASLPQFDEWGILPPEHLGPHSNPLGAEPLTTPLPAGLTRHPEGNAREDSPLEGAAAAGGGSRGVRPFVPPRVRRCDWGVKVRSGGAPGKSLPNSFLSLRLWPWLTCCTLAARSTRRSSGG
uniref:Uncharacterized protein n=1 Tax=Avena sativa TaxID=4498 RepID=A0ACD5VIB1_AVESA